MTSEHEEEPDSTAVRVALWRALHLEVDDRPPVLEDPIGLELADPAEGWRERGDMHPMGTRGFRASIVARARFIEDLLSTEIVAAATQYVMLGAGLDTLAQRHPELGERLQFFEIDQPGTQAWKRRRLVETGHDIPEWLHFVPVDFRTDADWWERLRAAGFDASQPALVASTGVTMYLTKDTTADTLRQLAGLAPSSTVAMTFLLPLELLDPADQPGLETSMRGAEASGTPFLSFFTHEEMLHLAKEAGFANARIVPSHELAARYFAGRSDDLRPSTGEDILVATT